MNFMHRNCEVQLELIKLVRDVMKQNADLLDAVDRIVRRQDAIEKKLEALTKIVTETAVNSEAIAQAKKQIDALTAKAGTIVAASQAVEDKLKDAGRK